MRVKTYNCSLKSLQVQGQAYNLLTCEGESLCTLAEEAVQLIGWGSQLSKIFQARFFNPHGRRNLDGKCPAAACTGIRKQLIIHQCKASLYLFLYLNNFSVAPSLMCKEELFYILAVGGGHSAPPHHSRCAGGWQPSMMDRHDQFQRFSGKGLPYTCRGTAGSSGPV